jgi:cell division protein FtsN
LNKFLVGLIFGIAIAGGLAVYLNNAPTPFINKAVEPVNSEKSSSPMILAPGTKIQEASATNTNNPVTTTDNKNNASEGSYDFYDVLQAKKAVNNNTNDVPAKPKSSEPIPQTKFFVQAGAFSSEELAADMKGRLALLGIDSTIKVQGSGDNQVNRVLIGPFATEENAQKIINQLSDGQINAALIRITK